MAAHRSNDPIKTGTRRAKTQRRVGVGAACADCGKSAPEVPLVARSRPKRCYACYQIARGKKPTEGHDIAGKSNSPIKIEVPANVHRSLSEAQYEWPRKTLQNPDGSPALRATAALRGARDLIVELLTTLFDSCIVLIEMIDAWLCEKHGKWWIGTPFEGWQPG
jgi:hypothetical protein